MTRFWKDEPGIAGGLETVAALIQSQASAANPYIASYLETMVASRGKMLRPALVLIGAKLGHPLDEQALYEQAALVEMIHIASLIHDDIIDSSPTRRGVPTLHSELGARRAVIAGDYMLSCALILNTRNHDGTEPVAAVSRAFRRLCDGEIVQDSEEWNFALSKSHYLRRIAGKTAAMFALSAYLGANRAGADRHLQSLMHRFGYNLGMAFQIRDDILDMTGSPETLGKPTGRDLRAGICTLPLICALRNDRSGSLARQLRGKTSLSPKEAEKIIGEIMEFGGIAQAESEAQVYSARASGLIQGLPDGETAGILFRMMDRLNRRDC